MANAAGNVQEITRALGVLFQPGQVTELRALKALTPDWRKPHTVSGYFDQADALAQAAAQLSQTASGVYVVVNPIAPSLLARAANRVRNVGLHDPLTSDPDILGRRWLLVDTDPDRPTGISANEVEHAAALARALQIRDWLTGLRWPSPVYADSGNGGHLLYRVDLPNDPASATLLQHVLEALDFLFTGDGVKIDTTVFNASRIWKLYGTWARKGDSTPDRPHRLSRLLDVPAQVEAVSLQDLQDLADRRPVAPPAPAARRGATGQPFNLEGWISEHRLDVLDPVPYQGSGRKWVFRVCPFNAAHTDRSAVLIQFPSGAVYFRCQHNGCSGHGWRDLRALVEPDRAAPLDEATSDGPDHSDGKDGPGSDSLLSSSDLPKKRPVPSQAQVLSDLGSVAELWHTPAGDAYATVPVDGHHETWPVRAKGFRSWLTRRFFLDSGKPPGAQALQDAIGVLEARGVFEGPARPVYTRVGELNGVIYLDLCDEAWHAVEVGPTGWRVVARPPIYFRRSKGMLPLPGPVKGGSLAELRNFINVPAEDDEAWVLIQAWLIAALRNRGPYPVLNLQGEQGSAKSTAARILRTLTDPSTTPLRDAPRDPRDLMIAATNSWVVAFDNLSILWPWLSDGLCRLSTGGGMSTRALYENDEEVLFDAMRPVIVNGIEDLAAREDLADRSLLVTLPPMPDTRRRPEAELWREYEAARPRILGALLDAVSAALRTVERTHLTAYPRMADFAQWVVAAEVGCSDGPEPVTLWASDRFMSVYNRNRQSVVTDALESNYVATAILALLEKRNDGQWGGTATELLEAIKPLATEDALKSKHWPTTARGMGGAVRRAAPFLRSDGVVVDFDRTTDGKRTRLIHLELSSKTLPGPSLPSEPSGTVRDVSPNGHHPAPTAAYWEAEL